MSHKHELRVRRKAELVHHSTPLHFVSDELLCFRVHNIYTSMYVYTQLTYEFTRIREHSSGEKHRPEGVRSKSGKHHLITLYLLCNSPTNELPQ